MLNATAKPRLPRALRALLVAALSFTVLTTVSPTPAKAAMSAYQAESMLLGWINRDRVDRGLVPLVRWYDLAVIVPALLPALIFAAANGTMEEVAYRGALQGWSAKVMGVGPAVIGQAVVFGLAHGGADVIAAPIPLMLLLGLGGLLAGWITVQTRSLLIPLAIHIGLDLPLYYALACPG